MRRAGSTPLLVNMIGLEPQRSVAVAVRVSWRPQVSSEAKVDTSRGTVSTGASRSSRKKVCVTCELLPQPSATKKVRSIVSRAAVSYWCCRHKCHRQGATTCIGASHETEVRRGRSVKQVKVPPSSIGLSTGPVTSSKAMVCVAVTVLPHTSAGLVDACHGAHARLGDKCCIATQQRHLHCPAIVSRNGHTGICSR